MSDNSIQSFKASFPLEYAEAMSVGAPVDDESWGLRHIRLEFARVGESGAPEFTSLSYCVHSSFGADGLDSEVVPAVALPTMREALEGAIYDQYGAVLSSAPWGIQVVGLGLYRKFAPSPDSHAVIQSREGVSEHSGAVLVESEWSEGAWSESSTLLLGAGARALDGACKSVSDADTSLLFGTEIDAAPQAYVLPYLSHLRVAHLWRYLSEAWFRTAWEFNRPFGKNQRLGALSLKKGRLVVSR